MSAAAAVSRIVLVDDQLKATLIAAPRLYAALRGVAAFAGSELNVEGAAAIDGRVRLFNRGNGAVVEGRRPLDASVDLSAVELLAFLRNAESAPVPALQALPEVLRGWRRAWGQRGQPHCLGRSSARFCPMANKGDWTLGATQS